jgi:hypothetical protein
MFKRFCYSLSFLFPAYSTAYCQDIIKSKSYYGNNNYHMPACIIDTKSKLNQQKLQEIGKKMFDMHPNQEGSICTLVKYKDEPYAVLYNRKPLSSEIKDTIILFEKFKKNYHDLRKKFEVEKHKTELKSHTIFGYYANLGSCGFKYDPGYLTIISSDSDGNYFISLYFCDSCKLETYPMLKTAKGYEREYKVWKGLKEPPANAKELLYERNGDFVVKDLSYVREGDEKYVYYLLKI